MSLYIFSILIRIIKVFIAKIEDLWILTIPAKRKMISATNLIKWVVGLVLLYYPTLR